MSKYIKLEDAIYSDCILIDEIMCEGCPFFDGERFLCRMMAWLESLPTYEVADLSDEAYEVGYTNGQMAERKRKIEVSEDCISRADLFEKMQSLCPETDKGCGDCHKVCDIDDCLDIVMNAPSVTTEQSSKVGEWIKQGISPYEGIQRCSICDKTYNITEEFNYCPNCGAKMKG